MITRALVVAVAVAALLVPLPAGWVESLYSRGFYARLQPLLTGLSNQVPFALFDVLLVGTLALASIVGLRALKRLLKRPGFGAVVRLGLNALAIVSVVYLAFLATWGLNYRRRPLSAELAFDGQAVTHEAVVQLSLEAVAHLNELHDRAHREGFGEWESLRPALERAFLSLHDRMEPGRRPRPGLPKWSLLSAFFERAGVSGMTDPFFLEVLVDRDLLPFERAFVLAHEWSHLAGYADEAEANFLGWLTCVNSGAPAAYSGWLYLYASAVTSLPRDERAPIVRALAAGPRADLAAVAARARRIQPIVQSVSWRVYDRYLKANRVEEGVASYDRALVLVLGTRFVDGWKPVLRSRQ